MYCDRSLFFGSLVFIVFFRSPSFVVNFTCAYYSCSGFVWPLGCIWNYSSIVRNNVAYIRPFSHLNISSFPFIVCVGLGVFFIRECEGTTASGIRRREKGLPCVIYVMMKKNAMQQMPCHRRHVRTSSQSFLSPLSLKERETCEFCPELRALVCVCLPMIDLIE